MLRRNNDFYFRFHCLQTWKHTDQSEDNMFIVYDRGTQFISHMVTRIDLGTTFHS
jgi:hypothetical protein